MSLAKKAAERKKAERAAAKTASDAYVSSLGTPYVYETGNASSPSNAQLAVWGITRDQYKSLYNKAKSEYIGTGGVQKGSSITNEVNKYLKSQMEATNGAYGRTHLNSQPETASATSTASLDGSGGGGGSSSGGGGGVAEYVPKHYTADKLAGRFGIVNDYATILKGMQDATTKKFDETETTMKRAESANLRSHESAYNQYLTDLRSRAANAVSAGATKGTMSANALTSLLGMQESNRESVNTMNELLYDTAQQRGTALATDANLARQQSNEIGQYLGNLATSMDTNDINAYAARIAAEAQQRAASIQAGATTSAARIGANSAYDQLMATFTQDYLNKNPLANYQTARNQAATSYVNALVR